MHVISVKKLRDFWRDPRNAHAEEPLRAWYQVVSHAEWANPADVKATYNTADFVGNKVVFDIGGNKYRLIAVIDFERHKLFVRFVLTHKEYDKGNWKKDAFGSYWTGPQTPPAARQGRRTAKPRQRRRGGKKR